MSYDIISIIVPVYNAEKFLSDTINSILNQTHTQFELILVNDGSTDNSQNIIDKYKMRDKRIVSIVTENKGAPHARNAGLEIAKGEYVIFFDADDLMLPNEIEVLAAQLGLDKEIDLVIGSRTKITENGDQFQEDILKSGIYDVKTNDIVYLMNISPFPDNKLYSTRLLKENKIKFADVRIAQDANLYLKYLSVCRKVAVISDVVCQYRIVDCSISRTYSKKIVDIVLSEQDIIIFIKDKKVSDDFIIAMNDVFVKYCFGQIQKIGFIPEKSAREEVLVTIGEYIIKFTNGMRLLSKESKRKLKVIRKMMEFKRIYTSNLYSYYRRTSAIVRNFMIKFYIRFKIN